MIGLVKYHFYASKDNNMVGYLMPAMLFIYAIINIVVNKDVGVAMFYAQLVCISSAAMCGSTFQSEKICKWNKFAVSLPFTRKDIIKSKYIYVAIILSINFSSYLLLFGFINFFDIIITDINKYLISGFITLSLLTQSCEMPIIIRINNEFGMILGVILGSVIGFAVLQIFLALGIDYNIIAYIMPVFGGLIFWSSYYVTINIYEKINF